MAISNTTYKVIATSAAGCNDTVSTALTVFPNAVISMIDTIQLYPGESFHIQPLSNCTVFNWFPTTGLSNASIIDPVINLGSSTVYTLTGTTIDGCSTTSMVHVDQKSESIFNVPNVFTPGKGVNNTFRLLKKGMGSLMYFRIYNRWGNLVFDTKNVDEGWEGAYQGAPQPFGVYIYEIRAVSSTGAIWNKMGNVTLVR
jgi:gliding motility-associated-like protein